MHLAVDAVGVLHTAVNRAVGDMKLLHARNNLILDGCHEFVVLRALALKFANDILVGDGVQIFQRQVLQLPFHLLHTEAVCNGCVNLHRFIGFFLLLFRGLVLHRTHIVQTVCNLDENNADVLAHGKEHLTQIFHLFLFQGAVLHAGQLGNTVHNIRYGFAKQLGNLVIGTVCILDTVVEQGGNDRFTVQTKFRYNLRYMERMGDIGAAILAELGPMVRVGIVVGRSDLFQVCRDIISSDSFFKMLIAFFHGCHNN